MQTRTPGMMLLAITASLACSPASADPCGMVPPITVEGPVPIARVGYQQTYVFYKEGVETFVIHPGFSGKVEEFGMLIPFPSVPEIRKVPDNIFPHLAASVDPPEVVVDLRIQFLRRSKSLPVANSAPVPSAPPGLSVKEEVRVVKEEAVGMYEVAVLEAGSAKALKKWMDDKGYKYPTGMDKACEDYVSQGWCFVAVKTKVAEKKGVDPQPGQRKLAPGLPDGSTFDGHVQAMGFRFKVKDLVVPMRLSTFNEGDLHNIVYILSDKPMKVNSIPEEYVVRQIPGSDLHRNVTGLLPLRVIGGTVAQIPQWQKQNMKQRRDPAPHNAAAKDLFAGDLLTVKTGELSHPHEEAEKMLLMIGERFGLRGPQIDKLNEDALAVDRKKIAEQSLADLKSNDLTLTVVDGNFPREVLAKQNLAFAPYRMPARRNKAEFYNAIKHGPSQKQPGVITYEAVSMNAPAPAVKPETETVSQRSSKWNWGFSAMFSCVVMGLVFSLRRQRKLVAIMLVAGLTLSVLPATFAQEGDANDEAKKPLSELEILDLIDRLEDPKQAEACAAELIKRGEKAVPHLLGEAIEGNNMAFRGWAIVCISEIGGKEAKTRLTEIQNDTKQPALIRTWAAAGRVKMAESTEDLLELANLIPQYPALGRPIGLRLLEKLKEGGDKVTAEDMLAITLRVPQLQQSLAPAILALGEDGLVKAMASAKDQNVRRQAAAYLGTLANQGNKEVPQAVVDAYAFDAEAKKVPWDGGPLFVPALQWNKKDAQALVGSLISWYLWADLNKQQTHHRALHNNLRSIQLAAAAGYQSPGFQQANTDQWLKVWGAAVGKEELKKILDAQKVADQPRFKAILDSL